MLTTGRDAEADDLLVTVPADVAASVRAQFR
jgi:hypothetical protein